MLTISIISTMQLLQEGICDYYKSTYNYKVYHDSPDIVIVIEITETSKDPIDILPPHLHHMKGDIYEYKLSDSVLFKTNMSDNKHVSIKSLVKLFDSDNCSCDLDEDDEDLMFMIEYHMAYIGDVPDLNNTVTYVCEIIMEKMGNLSNASCKKKTLEQRVETIEKNIDFIMTQLNVMYTKQDLYITVWSHTVIYKKMTT